MRAVLAGSLGVALVLGLASPASATPGPEIAPCPAVLPADTTCYGGQDVNGAYYSIAIPKGWNGSLVVHSHGGPDLGEPTPARTTDDLTRWSVVVREGYAWAGTSYRRGGYGTRMAAADTENLRKLVVARFGKPRKTFLHGQSWGGNVAAKTAELYPRSYDAVLLTSGVLAGGSRGYDYRVDLRVVYQYYCGNHPRPTEVQYPLWQGLRADSTMTSTGLRARLEECTGITSTTRTPLQQRNLSDILAVTHITESALASHLNFATFTFRDIVHNRLGDRNPFTTTGVVYSGSHDDAALNAGVERFTADPSAKRDLSYDSDITGTISVPVLTMHAIGDPTAFVEHEAAFRASMGWRQNVVQTFTTETEHSALSDSEYASVLKALVTWERTGRKPTPTSIAATCPANDAEYGKGCFFNPAYTPKSYASRVNARPGGTHWPALTPLQSLVWEWQGVKGIAP